MQHIRTWKQLQSAKRLVSKYDYSNIFTPHQNYNFNKLMSLNQMYHLNSEVTTKLIHEYIKNTADNSDSRIRTLFERLPAIDISFDKEKLLKLLCRTVNTDILIFIIERYSVNIRIDHDYCLLIAAKYDKYYNFKYLYDIIINGDNDDYISIQTLAKIFKICCKNGSKRIFEIIKRNKAFHDELHYNRSMLARGIEITIENAQYEIFYLLWDFIDNDISMVERIFMYSSTYNRVHIIKIILDHSPFICIDHENSVIIVRPHNFTDLLHLTCIDLIEYCISWNSNKVIAYLIKNYLLTLDFNKIMENLLLKTEQDTNIDIGWTPTVKIVKMLRYDYNLYKKIYIYTLLVVDALRLENKLYTENGLECLESVKKTHKYQVISFINKYEEDDVEDEVNDVVNDKVDSNNNNNNNNEEVDGNNNSDDNDYNIKIINKKNKNQNKILLSESEILDLLETIIVCNNVSSLMCLCYDIIRYYGEAYVCKIFNKIDIDLIITSNCFTIISLIQIALKPLCSCDAAYAILCTNNNNRKCILQEDYYYLIMKHLILTENKKLLVDFIYFFNKSNIYVDLQINDYELLKKIYSINEINSDKTLTVFLNVSKSLKNYINLDDFIKEQKEKLMAEVKNGTVNNNGNNGNSYQKLKILMAHNKILSSNKYIGSCDRHYNRCHGYITF